MKKKFIKRMKAFIADERGQAMTEYVILSAIIVVFCAWLYYPHNGIYKNFRDRFDLTALVLQWPGP
ncbi:MAG TPA: hypothetical protein DCZ95_02800 [Verrucomicrobia bacterium]|nr:MAG: hypothetical protein A2X46_14865 [Lentisphaerae bacterium GWF2_57_35]HBA83001.1 hypothetical protein [Verrucomicrobiota bacterium]